MVKRFDPSIARTHHRVLRSLQVDIEAITRAFKAQLPYARLLRPEGRRVLTAEEITDIDVSECKIGQVFLPEIRTDQVRSSGSRRRSFS